MPASVMSRLSFAAPDQRRVTLAAVFAKEITDREVRLMIEKGLLDPNNQEAYHREYRLLYEQTYRKYYPLTRPYYLENPVATKFPGKHTVANFSKSNYFIHVHQECITVGRINYPLDMDTSIETKEAFLSAWPGPLDRIDDNTRRKVSDYIDTLLQHDSQRRIRYSTGCNDDHRRTILKLLAELLHRNGKIDASGITRLLLRPEQTDIQKDEASKKPLETLQKYLLMGKRSEAIRFAKSRKLWDHAQCLAFLDKYQPSLDRNNPSNLVKYISDNIRLKDDSIVQLNDEFISTMGQSILGTVYKSLLNRILQGDPESVKIIKHPNVGSKAYDFAILSANDCEMEFDQTNETFRLIMAVKIADLNPLVSFNHLISLGYATLDSYDYRDDLSDPSHPSFKQDDTYASRSLLISNIDMLVLNEIWEYCLNLSKGEGTNLSNYDYIINLLPYKLIFASRLLDYGLHSMFSSYLDSIKRALSRAATHFVYKDPYYDWLAIERSVENLDRIWRDIFLKGPEMAYQQLTYSDYSLPPPQNLDYYNQPADFNPINTLPEPVMQNELHQDFPDSSHQDYPSLPYQGESNFAHHQPVPQPLLSQPQPPLQNYTSYKPSIPQSTSLYNQRIPEAITDFNPEPIVPQIEERVPYEMQSTTYNDYSGEVSRRQSSDMPVFSPPSSFGPTGTESSDRNQKAMTSSSPVNKSRDVTHARAGDSFNSPYSPINQYDDIPSKEPERLEPSNNLMSSNQMNASRGVGVANNNDNNNSRSQPSGDQQQSGFFTQLVGSAKSLLPKSNSKQMILPDDSRKSIVYDAKKGAWVDTSQPEEAAASESLDAPPMTNNVSKPTNYSFGSKSSKSRYPKAQF